MSRNVDRIDPYVSFYHEVFSERVEGKDSSLASYEHSVFLNADIRVTTFRDNLFNETIFTNCEIMTCDFSESSFYTHSAFIHTKICDSWFNQCVFDGYFLSNGTVFDNCLFKKAVFGNDVIFTNTVFRDCDFRDVELKNAFDRIFINCIFKKCRGIESQIP